MFYCVIYGSETASAVCIKEYVLWRALDREARTQFYQVVELRSHAARDVLWRQETERSVTLPYTCMLMLVSRTYAEDSEICY